MSELKIQKIKSFGFTEANNKLIDVFNEKIPEKWDKLRSEWICVSDKIHVNEIKELKYDIEQTIVNQLITLNKVNYILSDEEKQIIEKEILTKIKEMESKIELKIFLLNKLDIDKDKEIIKDDKKIELDNKLLNLSLLLVAGEVDFDIAKIKLDIMNGYANKKMDINGIKNVELCEIEEYAKLIKNFEFGHERGFVGFHDYGLNQIENLIKNILPQINLEYCEIKKHNGNDLNFVRDSVSVFCENINGVFDKYRKMVGLEIDMFKESLINNINVDVRIKKNKI